MEACTYCQRENPTNVDYCRGCNAAISEYAKQRELQNVANGREKEQGQSSTEHEKHSETTTLSSHEVIKPQTNSSSEKNNENTDDKVLKYVYVVCIILALAFFVALLLTCKGTT